MNVIKPSIPMKSLPDKMSDLETECLFGESLKILDKQTDWYLCKLLTDNYCGWVEKRGLGIMRQPTHRVISNRTFLFKKNDIKSELINYLPLGAQVIVEDFDKDWCKIILSENSDYKIAFIPSSHLMSIDKKIDDWVLIGSIVPNGPFIAERLIGTPYVWGGRDSIGLDCSALLQLSYQTYGENIPRNSIDQSLLEKKIIRDQEACERGFVVFWKGHVAIMTDNLNCVHANAFHMEVSKEPLSHIIKRSENNLKIIKIMNFN